MLSLVMLSLVMLNFIMPSVVMLNFLMLSVFMLSVIMLNVAMLSVVALLHRQQLQNFRLVLFHSITISRYILAFDEFHQSRVKSYKTSFTVIRKLGVS